MPKYFSAHEARKAAGPTVEEKVEKLCETIKKLAQEKKRQCRTGYDHRADEDLWISGGYSATKEWQEASKILTNLGYDVTFYYKEGSQFVDMYTLVKW